MDKVEQRVADDRRRHGHDAKPRERNQDLDHCRDCDKPVVELVSAGRELYIHVGA